MNFRNALALSLVAAACGGALAGPNTPASDVVTIDQSKAAAGGITSGDTAGFPITISAPGSYRLTSNLVVPAGVDAIQVSVDNVTIDLNGFSIKGPGTCGGQTGSMTCTALVTHGVAPAVSNIQRTTVQNGTVGGFGYCIDTRAHTRLTDLSLHDCHSALTALEGSILSRVAIYRSVGGGLIRASSAEQIQVYWANTGLSTHRSTLRGVSIDSVHSAFVQGGPGYVSALSMSSINSTVLGSGVQSVGGNLYNGVAF